MSVPTLASYIHFNRKRAGLSQKEIANLLGYRYEGEVSRHERFGSLPPFRIALAYEALFRIPISSLFPAAAESVKLDIEARLAKLAETLRKSTATGREAARIARKLEWIWERENPEGPVR